MIQCGRSRLNKLMMGSKEIVFNDNTDLDEAKVSVRNLLGYNVFFLAAKRNILLLIVHDE